MECQKSAKDDGEDDGGSIGWFIEKETIVSVLCDKIKQSALGPLPSSIRTEYRTLETHVEK